MDAQLDLVPKVAAAERLRTARSAAILGIFLPVIGLSGGAFGFAVFAPLALIGGGIAGAVALLFVSRHVNADEQRRRGRTVAALLWIVLCTLLPVIIILAFGPKRETLGAEGIVALVSAWGVAMALSLAAYVRFRSSVFHPNYPMACFSGGSIFGLFSLVVISVDAKVAWIAFLVASGLWAGTVTYFCLKPGRASASSPL